MDTFSLNDPKNTTSLKVKPVALADKSLAILIEILYLDKDNRTLREKVDFFLSVDEFDVIQYLFDHKDFPEKGYTLTKGKNGTARGIRFSHYPEKKEVGHFVISIANGAGNPGTNGFTKLETVDTKRMFNLSYYQTIKLMKYVERLILAFTINSIDNQ